MGEQGHNRYAKFYYDLLIVWYIGRRLKLQGGHCLFGNLALNDFDINVSTP